MTEPRRRKLLRIEMVSLAVAHVALGLVFGFGPDRVVNSSSLSAFRVMPDAFGLDGSRAAWFVAFLLCAAAITGLAWHSRLWAQYVTWGVVLWVDGVWLLAYAGPLTGGEGDPIGTVLFPIIMVWSAFVLYRVAQRNGG